MIKLTDNVRNKIAFEIFSTKKSHAEIAEYFKIGRSTVTAIAKEFKLQRTSPKGRNGPGKQTKRMVSNIKLVNETFDDEIVKNKLRETINRLTYIQHAL